MKKVIFAFSVDNVVDLITNSSSELFVLEGETKEIVEEMIKSEYPDYLSEYENVKRIDELSVDELDNFFSYACSPRMWPSSKKMYPVLPGFTFDELYEPEKDHETGLPKEAARNGEIQYQLKDNTTRNKDDKWHFGSFVTEENREEIINKLCPNKNMYFLYSLDENPNWEMQEKLENIAKRYHLG